MDASPASPGPIDPWRHVRVHFQRDLKLALLSLEPEQKTVALPSADIDIIRPHTMDASGGDADGDAGSEELLGAKEIHSIISAHAAKLGRCLDRRTAPQASIEFTISGKLGKITRLEVNGSDAGTLHTCLRKATATIKFPTTGGGQTHAHFALSI